MHKKIGFALALFGIAASAEKGNEGPVVVTLRPETLNLVPPLLRGQFMELATWSGESGASLALDPSGTPFFDLPGVLERVDLAAHHSYWPMGPATRYPPRPSESDAAENPSAVTPEQWWNRWTTGWAQWTKTAILE